MQSFAEFQILGHVGKIKEVGETLRVSVAAEYGRKDDAGNFVANPYWNEVTIFSGNTMDFVRQNVGPGDRVFVRGTMRDTQFERDGETVYGHTIAAREFTLLAKKADVPNNGA